MNVKTLIQFSTLATILLLASCASQSKKENYSRVTGWKYNDEKGTGFGVKKDFKTTVPPGMVSIEGGSFTIGEKGEVVLAPRNSRRRRITVSSFYMDQYEIRNVDWREYTHWMETVFGKTAPKLVQKTYPDGKIWREELAYNEPYIEHYFTHPAFDQYPVVGVTWEQVMDYCSWRTDRINELALINAGVIVPPDFASLKNLSFDSIINNFVFNTQKYLKQPTYQPKAGPKPKKDLYGQIRKADMSDGILLVSDIRLPTEAEWEYAAYALKADKNGFIPSGKIYPWNGYGVRNPSKKELGQMMANFVRGRGDMMGTAGALNDRATITAPVDSYYPNDFGLYNMAGNVNEWVLDVYRVTSFDDVSEYNSFRGNVYPTYIVEREDELGNKIYKIDSLGRIATTVLKKDDVRNYKDGDPASKLSTDFIMYGADSTDIAAITNMTKIDPTDVLAPQITEKTRVYKGGSWKDRVYWLNPSTRRYLDQDQCANDIGFRCAMSKIGSIEPVKY